MAIFFGLAAAAGWGVADFCVGYAARLVGSYRTLFYMQFVGFAALSFYLALTGQFVHLMQPAYLVPWLWVILAALINVTSSLLFYRAVEIGTLSIVSPIIACYSAVTVAISVLNGEMLSITHTFGIIASIIGVTLAATSFQSAEQRRIIKSEGKRRMLPPGVLMTVIASVGYGILFWLLGVHATPFLGGIAPVWMVRLMTIIVLPILARPTRQSLRIPRGYAWWSLLGVGIFDTVGYTMDTLGLTTGQIAIVSVLASFFTVVTILLAAIFLRERLQLSQWGGIALIFVGIALVNI